MITVRDKNADNRQLPAGGCLSPDWCWVAVVSPVLACHRPCPRFHIRPELFPARHKNNGHLLFTAEVIKRWSSILTFSAAVLCVRGIFRPRVTVTLCKEMQTGHIVAAWQSEEIKFRIHLAYFAIH